MEQEKPRTIEDWINSKIEVYGPPDAIAIQALSGAARAFVDAAASCGFPALAFCQTAQTATGEFEFLIESRMGTNVARMGPGMLLMNVLVSGENDPVGAAMNVMQAYSLRMGKQ